MAPKRNKAKGGSGDETAEAKRAKVVENDNDDVPSEVSKDWNFKVCTWNVDGLRAMVKKGGLDYLRQEDPDVICLQEIKCSLVNLPGDVKDLEGYRYQYWKPADKDGYAGVGLLSKLEPLRVTYGLADHLEDDGGEDAEAAKAHDGEGRSVIAEFERFHVVSVYVPNSGKKLVTLPKRLEWNRLFRKCLQKLDGTKPVIVCGDLNVAHKEADLANPKTNKKNAGFTQEERDGMDELLGDGFVDTFRHFYPDRTGAYTFWTYMMNARAKNVGWRLDYFLTSRRLVVEEVAGQVRVCDNQIRDKVLGSDHCPSVLLLQVQRDSP